MTVCSTVAWPPKFQCVTCHMGVLFSDGNEQRCPECDSRFPIIAGVLRCVSEEQYSGSFGFQWNRFARTQLDSANGTRQSRDAFLEKTGWQLDELNDQVILDAGCGMGRFAEVALGAGARVCAIDLSCAVVAANRNLAGGGDRVRVVQADIMNLPFSEGSFDRIYSLGVLHHTPDTREAFLRLTRLLRPGGQISIWVYSRELEQTLRAAEVWRKVTTRLPEAWLLQLCRVAVPLSRVHRTRLLGRLSRRLFPTSVDADPDWCWLGTFDWYSPRYQWKHTDDEVRGWFRDAGLTGITALPFPVSYTGLRPA